MIYLDYSATTKTDDRVLYTFIKVSKDYIGNPNSLHKLGYESNKLIESASKQINNLLNVDKDIIYTSGASEANNLAIKGIAEKYKNRGNHIITTPLEHSSVIEPMNYLKNKGFIIDILELDQNGRVDLKDLEKKITDKTILVSINAVNSELGILQPLDDISRIIKKYNKCIFHSDITQAIGKINIDISYIDLVSFSAHKFFGIKGVGALIKNKKIDLEPLIHGGKSTTIYRSGTPSTPLIASLAKALRLALEDIDTKYNKVLELNKYIKENLKKYSEVTINSNEYSIPHILNISILDVKPETFIHALEEYEIYISTKSACSTSNESKAVYMITKSHKRALSSLRISISSITAKEECDEFLRVFDMCYKRLINLKK